MKRRTLVPLLVVLGASAVAFFLAVLAPTRPPATGLVVEIEMTTQQWRFEVVRITSVDGASASSVPSTGATPQTRLVVPRGATVILHIQNVDVSHGFALEEFGVNTVTPPGEVTTVRFVASQAGEFVFFCTVFCGTGHPSHKGSLVVTG